MNGGVCRSPHICDCNAVGYTGIDCSICKFEFTHFDIRPIASRIWQNNDAKLRNHRCLLEMLSYLNNFIIKITHFFARFAQMCSILHNIFYFTVRSDFIHVYGQSQWINANIFHHPGSPDSPIMSTRNLRLRLFFI